MDGPFDLAWRFGCYALPLTTLEIYLWVDRYGTARGKASMAAALVLLAGATGVGIVGALLFMWRPFLSSTVGGPVFGKRGEEYRSAEIRLGKDVAVASNVCTPRSSTTNRSARPLKYGWRGPFLSREAAGVQARRGHQRPASSHLLGEPP